MGFGKKRTICVIGRKEDESVYQTQVYQKRIARAFNKKVRPNKIKEGDLVLKQSRSLAIDPRGKFKLNWEGPFLVKKILRNGATQLTDLEGNEFKEPINLDRLKKYFA